MRKKHPEFVRLKDSVRGGAFPVVEFCDAIEDYDVEVDPGCRARLVSVGLDLHQTAGEEGDDGYCVILSFDCTDFMEYNDPFNQPNYFDKNGLPTRKVTETSFWPDNNIVKVWFDGYDDPYKYFRIIPNEADILREKWMEHRQDAGDDALSYTAFLERMVLRYREWYQ